MKLLLSLIQALCVIIISITAYRLYLILSPVLHEKNLNLFSFRALVKIWDIIGQSGIWHIAIIIALGLVFERIWQYNHRLHIKEVAISKLQGNVIFQSEAWRPRKNLSVKIEE